MKILIIRDSLINCGKSEWSVSDDILSDLLFFIPDHPLHLYSLRLSGDSCSLAGAGIFTWFRTWSKNWLFFLRSVFVLSNWMDLARSGSSSTKTSSFWTWSNWNESIWNLAMPAGWVRLKFHYGDCPGGQGCFNSSLPWNSWIYFRLVFFRHSGLNVRILIRSNTKFVSVFSGYKSQKTFIGVFKALQILTSS